MCRDMIVPESRHAKQACPSRLPTFLRFTPARDTMPGMRFSLFKLLLAVAMVAVACGGLMGRTRWWAIAIFSATLLLFVAVAVRGIRFDGRGRAAALTFAIVGMGYLLMSMIQPVRDLLVTQQALVALGRSLYVSTQMQTPVIPALPTLYTGSTTLITGSAVPQPSTSSSSTGSGTLSLTPAPTASLSGSGTLTLSAPGTTFYGTSPAVPFDEWDNTWSMPLLNPFVPAGAFLFIGHCIWAWLFALLAAWLAGVMYARRTAS